MRERWCPSCGCPAPASNQKVKGRVVWGCSNRECGQDFIILNGKAITVKNGEVVPRPLRWEPYGNPPRDPKPNYPVVREMASILSPNGSLGCVWLIEYIEGWGLEAGGEDTGLLWKSPSKIYPTADEAKNVAAKLWKAI